MNLKPYLALVRIPTLFSAMSNVFAGYFIGKTVIVPMGSDTSLIGFAAFGPALPPGLLASGALIMAGMALNDVADAKVDARERPERPIPSGAIAFPTALALSMVLMFGALVLLFLTNILSAQVGLGLVLAIVGYNFLFKGTFLGPASMGVCRALNLLLGMSLTWAHWPPAPEWDIRLTWPLLSLFGYILLITFLARDEVAGNTRFRTRTFLIGIGIGWVSWLLLATVFLPVPYLISALVVLGMFLFLLREPYMALWSLPSPRNTGRSIGASLRYIPLVDVLAMLWAGVHLPIALSGLLWILPAYFIGRLYYST